MKLRGRHGAIRRRHHDFWMRVWRSCGSLYGSFGAEELQIAQADAAPEELRQPISAMPVLSGGVMHSDKLSDPNRDENRFLIEHLLSLGELGLLRKDGKVHERNRRRTCRTCYGYPWRVSGAKCSGCGLAAENESERAR